MSISEREGQQQRDSSTSEVYGEFSELRQREGGKERVCVCVCVRKTERERESGFVSVREGGGGMVNMHIQKLLHNNYDLEFY